ALFARFDRRGNMNLDKRHARRIVKRAHGVAVLAVGADEAGHGNDRAVDKELGNLADAADILFTVGGREAKVLVQAMPNVVAVEDVCQVAALDQCMLECEGNRALARPTQAGEPEGCALLFQQGGTLLVRDMTLVPDDIGCLDLAHVFTSESSSHPSPGGEGEK